MAFVFCVFCVFFVFVFSYGAHRIAQSLRQLNHSLAVPSTPSDGTITRLVRSRGRPLFTHAPSRALVVNFHVVCPSGPSFAPNSRPCSPFQLSDDRAADPLDVLRCIYPRCRERTHSTSLKRPVRAGLRLGSPSKRAPKSVHSSSPWGIFLICRVPWAVVEGVTSKSTIGT